MSSNNYFSSSSRSRMGSNAYTDVNQGGGNKKAGFPYMIGRDSWSSVYINTCNPKISPLRYCSLTKLQFTANPHVNQSQGIGYHPRGAYTRMQ